MPHNDRPIRFTERSSFTLSIAFVVALLSGSATAATIWAKNESAREAQARVLTDHETRMQRLESKMEDVTTIKNDVAWIKQILERREQSNGRTP